METKRNKNYIEIENKFINSLIDLLQKKGYRDVSVNDIIERAGVKSKKTFYLHFKDKEDMFVKMQEQFMDRIVRIYEETSGLILYFTNKDQFYKNLTTTMNKNLRIGSCFAYSPFATDFIRYIADKITDLYKKNYTTGYWKDCKGPKELFNFYHLFVSGFLLECLYTIKDKKPLDFKKIETAALSYRKFDDAYCLEYYTKLSQEGESFILPDVYVNYMIDLYPESKDIWEGHTLITNLK